MRSNYLLLILLTFLLGIGRNSIAQTDTTSASDAALDKEIDSMRNELRQFVDEFFDIETMQNALQIRKASKTSEIKKQFEDFYTKKYIPIQISVQTKYDKDVFWAKVLNSKWKYTTDGKVVGDSLENPCSFIVDLSFTFLQQEDSSFIVNTSTAITERAKKALTEVEQKEVLKEVDQLLNLQFGAPQSKKEFAKAKDVDLASAVLSTMKYLEILSEKVFKRLQDEDEELAAQFKECLEYYKQDIILDATSDFQVVFEANPNQLYGFDSPDGYNTNDFTTASMKDGGVYTILEKGLESQRRDSINAIFTGDAELMEEIKFKFHTGTKSRWDGANVYKEYIKIDKANKRFRILFGILGGADEVSEVHAFHKDKLIGMFKIHHYQPLAKKITLVQVNKEQLVGSVSQIEQEVNAIYKAACINIQITSTPLEVDFNLASNGLDEDKEGKLLKYSSEMKELRDAFFTQNPNADKDGNYVFVVNQFSNDDLNGYMPRGRNIGFIKSQTDLTSFVHYLSHEIGHGLFGLEHYFPFDSRGGTRNLMDYHRNAGESDINRLTRIQWDEMHHFKGGSLNLDDNKDAAAYNQDGTEYIKLCDQSEINKVNESPYFYLLDRRMVDLSELSGAKANFFYGVNDVTENAQGTLSGFLYKNKQYWLNYEASGLVTSFKSNALRISVNDLLSDEFSKAQHIYIDKEKKQIRNDKTNEKFNFTECPKTLKEGFFINDKLNVYVEHAIENNTSVKKSLLDNEDLIKSLVKKAKNNEHEESKLGIRLVDKLRAYEKYNDGKFIVVFAKSHTLSTSPNSWARLAEQVFIRAGLGENDILITIPYMQLKGISLADVYAMPGIAHGNKVRIDKGKIEKSINTISYSEWFLKCNDEKAGVFTDFVHSVFKSTYKHLIIYKGVLEPNFSISVVKFETKNGVKVPNHDQNAYIKLYKHSAFDKVTEYVKDIQDIRFGIASGAVTFSGYVSQTMDDNYQQTLIESKQKTAKLLLNVDPNLINEFVIHEQEDFFEFKDEFLEKYAEEYILKKAYKTYIENFKDVSSKAIHLPEYTIDVKRSDTWNLEDRWIKMVDDIVYTSLDVASIGLAFFGLDIIADGMGLIYATARGDMTNISLTTMAVLIPFTSRKSIEFTYNGVKQIKLLVTTGIEKVKTISKIITPSSRKVVLGITASLEPTIEKDILDYLESNGVDSKIYEEIYSKISQPEKQKTYLNKLYKQVLKGTGKLKKLFSLEIRDKTLKILPEEEIHLFNPYDATGVVKNLDDYEQVAIIPINKISFDRNVTNYPFSNKNIVLLKENGVTKCYIDDGYCFVAGTPIAKGENSANIEDVIVGDQVKSYDHNLKQTKTSNVTKLFRKTVNKLTKVFVAGTMILSTTNHPYYANGEYTNAEDLNSGDELITVSGEKLHVDSISTIDTTAQVYNFEVEGFHNYFAGEKQILVHNTCGWKTIRKKLLEEDKQKILQDFSNALIETQLNTAGRKEFYDRIATLPEDDLVSFIYNAAYNKEFMQLYIDNPAYTEAFIIMGEVAGERRAARSEISYLKEAVENLDEIKSFKGGYSKWLKAQDYKNIKNHPRLAEVVAGLSSEYQIPFLKQFDGASDEVLKTFSDSPDLVEIWKLAEKSNSVNIVRELDNLVLIKSQLPEKFDSDDIEYLVKEINETGWEKWVDKVDYSKLFTSFKHLSSTPKEFQQFLAKKNWNKEVLEKLEKDFTDVSFQKIIFEKQELVSSWKKIINQPEWVRKNTDLLSDLVGKNNNFIERVNVFYNNIALPANLPKLLPNNISHTFNGQSIVVNYNKYGLPEFGEHMTRITDNGSNVTKTYKGAWNQVTSSHNAARAKDLKDATNWALKTDAAGNLANFPNGRVRRYITLSGNPSPTKIEILNDNGNWIEQTWHHHENGRDLIPVPSEIHNPLNHSGGFTAKHGSDGTVINLDTDVTEIFDYDPVIN